MRAFLLAGAVAAASIAGPVVAAETPTSDHSVRDQQREEERRLRDARREEAREQREEARENRRSRR